MKKFCDCCLEETNVNYFEENVLEFVENTEISYLKKYYKCCECDNIIYDDLWDYNILTVNEKIREQNEIITIREIEEILEKYNIGKKPLSLVLGLGEVTITRYLNGQNPTKENSDLLKIIKNNPYMYEMFLLGNKDKIKEIAFKKSLGKTKQIQLSLSNSKIYNVALYILSKYGDTTPLSLQKILYFVNGFSKFFLKNKLFNDKALAWVHGPVYEDIYRCFSYYKYNTIDYEEILKIRDYSLSDEELEYLDNVIVDFACYSAVALREMSHLTEPWIKARIGLNGNENSHRVIEAEDIDNYFSNVIKKYKIDDVSKIREYSKSLFENALNELK